MGLALDELIGDAQHFRGRHLPAHSVNVRSHHLFDRTIGKLTGNIPERLAQRAPLSATHLIVSDCRWFAPRPPKTSEHLVYVRPRLFTTGTLWAPSSSLVESVRQGAAAVTDEILERLGRWRSMPVAASHPAG